MAPPRRAHAPADNPDGRMTLVEHLTELRSRLVKSSIAVVVTTAAAFAFHQRVLAFLTHPYCKLPVAHRLSGGHTCALIATGVLEGLNVSLEVSLYVGLLAAAPIWLYQLWRFITPGLHRHERRYAVGFVALSSVLFFTGVVLAYLMLGYGLRFLLGFAAGTLTPALKIDSYLAFLTHFAVAFGAAFEFPVVLIMLNLAGLVSYQRLRHWWRGAIFAIFAFAAVATPTGDPLTMTAMALPMCALYGAVLLFARAHDARKARAEAADPLHHVPDDQPSPLEFA